MNHIEEKQYKINTQAFSVLNHASHLYHVLLQVINMKVVLFFIHELYILKYHDPVI